MKGISPRSLAPRRQRAASIAAVIRRHKWRRERVPLVDPIVGAGVADIGDTAFVHPERGPIQRRPDHFVTHGRCSDSRFAIGLTACEVDSDPWGPEFSTQGSSRSPATGGLALATSAWNVL